ncbi:MAG: sel1 repeat family protein, partial [Xanthobacteraceae bacterium]
MRQLLLAAAASLVVTTAAQAQATRPATPSAPPAEPATGAPPLKPEDVAYGAYQRGYCLTALNEATKLANENNVKAMALLGELYAN